MTRICYWCQDVLKATDVAALISVERMDSGRVIEKKMVTVHAGQCLDACTLHENTKVKG